eukprot:14219347-Heterocapsa_arctica.AAC.1
MTKQSEVNKIEKQLKERSAVKQHSIIWLALPCTGRCSWQSLNRQRGAEDKIQEERETFRYESKFENNSPQRARLGCAVGAGLVLLR